MALISPTLYNLSEERIIEKAQVNLAYKWFLSLNPEDTLPDPSLLSKFHRHRVGIQQVEAVLYDYKRIVRLLFEKKVLYLDLSPRKI
ncbi:transposase [Bacillus sp. CGMCC 1.60114]|uniref:transposase n=1 Tax=unclassified Bacillus (in: firmicutes) TaxID=185979 RepID=UPI00362B855F